MNFYYLENMNTAQFSQNKIDYSEYAIIMNIIYVT